MLDRTAPYVLEGMRYETVQLGQVGPFPSSLDTSETAEQDQVGPVSIPTRRSNAAGLSSLSDLSIFRGVLHFWQYIVMLPW
jgi:hypothetical protein